MKNISLGYLSDLHVSICKIFEFQRWKSDLVSTNRCDCPYQIGNTPVGGGYLGYQEIKKMETKREDSKLLRMKKMDSYSQYKSPNC